MGAPHRKEGWKTAFALLPFMVQSVILIRRDRLMWFQTHARIAGESIPVAHSQLICEPNNKLGTRSGLLVPYLQLCNKRIIPRPAPANRLGENRFP